MTCKKELPGREVPEFFQRFMGRIPTATLTPRGVRLSNQGENMDSKEKRPRFFYFEDACDALIPCGYNMEHLLEHRTMGDGEGVDLHIQRIDMTDEAFNALEGGESMELCLRYGVRGYQAIRNRLQMDETIVPSHRCTKCGALWRFWTPQEQPTTEGGWSLVGNDCGTCCDNAEMGEQIAPLTMGDLRLWL